MSDEMAVADNSTGDEDTMNTKEAVDSGVVAPPEAAGDQPSESGTTDPEDQAEEASSPPADFPSATKPDPDHDEEQLELIIATKTEIKEEPEEDTKSDENSQRGIKRRASIAFSEEENNEFKGFEEIDDFKGFTENDDFKGFDENSGFKGFETIKQEVTENNYSHILDRLEAEVFAATKDFVPVRRVKAKPSTLFRSSKRQRTDTDGSRPSSAMSSRSEGDPHTDASAASSPAHRGGRRATTEMSSPLLRVPLERGWKRELVYRASLDSHSRRNADIYYYSPQGKKLRSTREVSENLAGTGLTVEHFSFFKEPLGVDDPDKEIIRDAKILRRVESPILSTVPPAPVDSKRTPKPKAPKGASPEPTPKSPPAKIKVKSVGSRLSGNSAHAQPSKQQKKNSAASTPATSTVDNNNSATWKKPSEEKRRGRVANGAASPQVAAVSAGVSPRRRGRQRADDTDHFTAFCNKATENNNVVIQIFQYLGMRDLAHCARVCKLWRNLAGTPALWRHVRMKNSHVSDWAGLCAALKKHGTNRLDLRKMLLPQNDNVFWDQFAQHIPTVDSLERIEMCRCPARAVEAVCRGLPGLRSLSALAIRDHRLDPAPLASLPLLEELRLKSMSGLSLVSDLRHLSALRHLNHLSLTSIKDLGCSVCSVLGSLPQLESLEMGECALSGEFAAAVGRLTRLRRLRLERGTAQCAAPATLRTLATLPLLTRLELVNVDVKVGFDDALAECKNIQRLLIIPTYVSQSATTNKQVLSGVLRLKDTLTHLMWGVTIELLRVTELFIDQCDQSGDAKKKDVGECIPVLKPVPGSKPPEEHNLVSGPPQVEILPLPTLQRLLSAQLPNTKLKLLRIPFHATWRQTLADFQ